MESLKSIIGMGTKNTQNNNDKLDDAEQLKYSDKWN